MLNIYCDPGCRLTLTFTSPSSPFSSFSSSWDYSRWIDDDHADYDDEAADDDDVNDDDGDDNDADDALLLARSAAQSLLVAQTCAVMHWTTILKAYLDLQWFLC